MQRQRARARCWQHFLSALFSGCDGAKHDKSMTAAGVAAEREAEVAPDVNTNLEKWDKRQEGKQGEAKGGAGGGGKGTGLGCVKVAALVQEQRNDRLE